PAARTQPSLGPRCGGGSRRWIRRLRRRTPSPCCAAPPSLGAWTSMTATAGTAGSHSASSCLRSSPARNGFKSWRSSFSTRSSSFGSAPPGWRCWTPNGS
ncbi:unnamed protein product, partial [Effrenium voratum]